MIVVTSPTRPLMVVTSDVMVHTVLLSAHRDTDLRVDGESSARQTTPGPTADSLHVSLVLAWMLTQQTSTLKFKIFLSKISQSLNFSAVIHPISWS